MELWLHSKGYALSTLLYSTPTCRVYSGSHPNCPLCPSQVAIKVQTYQTQSAFEGAEKEIRTMKELCTHPHAVRLYEYFWEEVEGRWRLVLVTEYMEKDLMKDLEQRRKNEYPWREEELWEVARDLVDVLAFAQIKGISHRDIKPSNIFFNPVSKQVKLGDFGSSSLTTSLLLDRTVVGTPLYMSSELRRAAQLNLPYIQHDVVKSDVYSLGITLLTLAKLSVTGAVMIQDRENAVMEEIMALRYSQDLKNMIFDMVNCDVDARLTFVELKSRYFGQCAEIEEAEIATNPDLHANPEIYAPPPTDSLNFPLNLPPLPAISQSFPSYEMGKETEKEEIPVVECVYCSEYVQGHGLHANCMSCPGGTFCSVEHFRAYTIEITNQFQLDYVSCPKCNTGLLPSEVQCLLGGPALYNLLKSHYTDEGLNCAICKSQQAVFLLSCQHIICKACKKRYKLKTGGFCQICNQSISKPERIIESGKVIPAKWCFWRK